MQDTLFITVEYSTEDEDYGPMYIATNDDIGLVTDGKTFAELMQNLEEAIRLCLEDTDTIAAFGLISNPRIKLVMELPKNYAEIA